MTEPHISPGLLALHPSQPVNRQHMAITSKSDRQPSVKTLPHLFPPLLPYPTCRVSGASIILKRYDGTSGDVSGSRERTDNKVADAPATSSVSSSYGSWPHASDAAPLYAARPVFHSSPYPPVMSGPQLISCGLVGFQHGSPLPPRLDRRDHLPWFLSCHLGYALPYKWRTQQP